MATPIGQARCQIPGCTAAKAVGHGRYYCEQHECDYDNCRAQAKQRGRCSRHAFCAVPWCDEQRRQVQRAKYCELHATSINYTARGVKQAPLGSVASGPCLVCDVVVTRVRNSRPLLLCVDHVHLRHTFKTWRNLYHMTDEQIRSLAIHPLCWFCGDSLAWRLSSYGKAGMDHITVDHDHACCEGVGSCGKCIRGLAHMRCNQGFGQVESMLDLLGDERLVWLIQHRHDAIAMHNYAESSTDRSADFWSPKPEDIPSTLHAAG